jgi:predicted HAD superfamily Cof-like phosphohydrolase
MIDIEAMLQNVTEFHEMMGFYPLNDVYVSPEDINEKRKTLIMEEALELCDAIDEGDAAEILHEAIDEMYVTFGSLLEAGITPEQIDEAWIKVHEANMTKTPPADPLDKGIKGDGFRKADI